MDYKRRATARGCIRVPKSTDQDGHNRLVRANLSAATAAWGRLEESSRERLKTLPQMYLLNVAAGELCLLDGRRYVTHTGLLGLAERHHCSGIRSIVEKSLSDPSESRWVFKATVFKSPHSRGFVGYGDADPSNVSSLVHGSETRVAETRAALQQNVSGPHLESRLILAQVHSTFDLAHGRRLFPRFKAGNCAVSLLVSFRIARSRRNSICRLSERCSCCASSTIFALRLAGMRIRSRAFGSAGGLGMGPTGNLVY
jgi:hypothetical protein